MFSINGLRQQTESVFKSASAKLVQVLDKKAESGESFDMQELFQNLVFDAFCEIAFGETPGSLDSDTKPPFLVAFDRGKVGLNSNVFQLFFNCCQ